MPVKYIIALLSPTAMHITYDFCKPCKDHFDKQEQTAAGNIAKN